MGETSVYYVPRNQRHWAGRADDLASDLFHAGIILSHKRVDALMAELNTRNEVPPDCGIEYSFASCGVTDEVEPLPVPHHVYDVSCPSCGEEVVEQVYGVWSAPGLSEIPFSDREVVCPGCKSPIPAGKLRYGEPITFAKVFLWFSDVDHDDWSPDLREIIEKVVGPCDEFWEWST